MTWIGEHIVGTDLCLCPESSVYSNMGRHTGFPLHLRKASLQKKAVFIDRDGTITEEVGYLDHPDKLKLIKGSAEAIKLINDLGMKVILVTNQSGVARGYFPEQMIKNVHDCLEELLSVNGAKLDGIYFCPHHPTAGESPYRSDCECRKPKTGMIKAALQDFDIDLKHSYMIGDKMSDMEFAHNAGIKGILVQTGYGKKETAISENIRGGIPDMIADNILEAATWIKDEESSLL